MGNTHDTEIARIEADYIKTKYRSQGDYRWGYTGDRGRFINNFASMLCTDQVTYAAATENSSW